MVRKDLTELDPQLRERLRTFYERKLLPRRPLPRIKRRVTCLLRSRLVRFLILKLQNDRTICLPDFSTF